MTSLLKDLSELALWSSAFVVGAWLGVSLWNYFA